LKYVTGATDALDVAIMLLAFSSTLNVRFATQRNKAELIGFKRRRQTSSFRINRDLKNS
jgi:hypothetical protein